MNRILIIEDNSDLAFLVGTNLEIAGYAVELTNEGPQGLERARVTAPDLIILDLMLPGLSGYLVLRSLREEGFHMPVLILSARGEEVDKVLGFRNGADDYVTKPCGALELLARVEALLRRAGGLAADTQRRRTPHLARFGDVEVNLSSHTVRRRGQPVTLSPKAYQLLCALLMRRGQLVSRQDLLREVWGYHETVESRTVDAHIVELRRNLEADPSLPRHIVTVRKAGYRLEG